MTNQPVKLAAGGLLPQPRSCSLGSTPVPPTTVAPDRGQIHWHGAQDPRVAARLSELLPAGLDRPLHITLAAASTLPPALGVDESYRLVFTPASVTLEAATTWGALWAVTSLWQLQVGGALPASGEINDAPRFLWRGVLIDVARHFLPIEQLHRVVEGMSRLKLNVLHLHLADDQAFRWRSAAYPRLAAADSYGGNELRALVEAAAQRGVRIVPELDVPGHVNSWLTAYPQWGLQTVAPSARFGVHPACLNVADENVYTALETLFTEITEVFPDEYVHIGGDEVHPGWWRESGEIAAYMAQFGLTDARALQAHFNQRLVGLLQSMGRQAVAWDEALHADMPTLVVQNWRGATTRDRALAAGQRCIVSSGYYLDLFYPAEMHYRFDPGASQQALLDLEDDLLTDRRLQHVAQGLAWTAQWREGALQHSPPPATAELLLGGEACLWAELVDADTLDVRLWSRLPAVAERLWSPSTVTDVDDFYRRLAQLLDGPGYELTRLQHTRLQQLGLTSEQVWLAGYLEPVKWYARLLGETALQARLRGSEMPLARPYDANTALNRVVDHLAPESLPARTLRDADRDTVMGVCRRWSEAQPQAWPADVQAAVYNLQQLGTRMMRWLNDAQRHTGGAELEAEVAALQALYVPCGEYLVAVVPWLIDWLRNEFDR